MLVMAVFYKGGKENIKYTHCEERDVFNTMWAIKEAHNGKVDVSVYGEVAPNTYTLVSESLGDSYRWPEEIHLEEGL